MLARLVGQADTLAGTDPMPKLEAQAWDAIRDPDRVERWRRAFLERPVVDPRRRRGMLGRVLGGEGSA